MQKQTLTPEQIVGKLRQIEVHHRRLTVTLIIVRYVVVVGVLTCAMCVTRLVSPSLGAQGAATGVEALQKAHVLERLIEAMPAPHKGMAPSFYSILHGRSRSKVTGSIPAPA